MSAKKTQNTEANRVISLLGGTSATALLCGITPGAVTQWRANGIPRTQRKYLEVVRPDIFSTQAAPACVGA